MKRLSDIDSFEIEDHKNMILPIKVFGWGLSNEDSFFRHWHKEFEITIICSGSGVYELNLVEYVVGEGDLIIVENEMLHYGYGIQNGFEAITLIFDMAMFHSVLQDSIDTKYILPIINGTFEILPVIKNAVKANPWLTDKIKHLLELYTNRGCGFELQLKAGIFELIAYIISNNFYKTQNVETRQSNSTVNAIKIILKYIDENLQNTIYLPTLAQLVNFDKSYMSRFFKKHLGITCTEYITRCRLNKASQLLATTGMTVTEIAFETGFTNISFFLKKFKERYSVTPIKYRKQNTFRETWRQEYKETSMK